VVRFVRGPELLLAVARPPSVARWCAQRSDEKLSLLPGSWGGVTAGALLWERSRCGLPALTAMATKSVVTEPMLAKETNILDWKVGMGKCGQIR
jgi:hypothetical protein